MVGGCSATFWHACRQLVCACFQSPRARPSNPETLHTVGQKIGRSTCLAFLDIAHYASCRQVFRPPAESLGRSCDKTFSAQCSVRGRTRSANKGSKRYAHNGGELGVMDPSHSQGRSSNDAFVINAKSKDGHSVKTKARNTFLIEARRGERRVER